MKKPEFSHILIIFDTEKQLLNAYDQLFDHQHFRIVNIYSPVPIDLLANNFNKNTGWSGVPALLGGLMGFLLALIFQLWVNTTAYPLIFGGKPYLSPLSYVPVVFESTILISSLMLFLVFVFQIRNSKFSFNNKKIKTIPENMFSLQLQISSDVDDDFIHHQLSAFSPEHIIIQKY